MSSFDKNMALLASFGIPSGEGADVLSVRGILARILSLGAVRLANLQTTRDIVEHAHVQSPDAYLFLTAMFISERKGNAFMAGDDAVPLLIAAGHEEGVQGLGLAETNEQYEKNASDICASFRNAVWKRSLEGNIVVREDGDRWYFQRNHAAVRELNDILKGFATSAKGEKASDALVDAASTFDGFALNDAQKKALRAAVSQRFTVITGGPGTGKTTTVCAILRALLAEHPEWTEKDIALAAPTGRAAQRMQEAILDQCKGTVANERIGTLARKLEGATVHRILGGYAPNWKHNEKRRLEQKVVIVDETSMVDIYLMQALLKALPDDARLILLGDADQLPSVDTGAVLGDLTRMGMGTDIVKRLETCERAKGEICEVARAINSFDGSEADVQALMGGWAKIGIESLPCLPDAIPAGQSEFRWLEPRDGIKKQDIMGFYGQWMSGSRLVELAWGASKDEKALQGERTEKSEALFKELNRCRILTLVREGRYGVKEANAALLKKAKQRAGNPYGDYLAMPGVPIMVTKNTDRKLFNGDVGVTVRSANGMVVIFPRGEKTVVCPVARLPEHELAYAMTVHKSQGSEFENVLVMLPNDANHPLLNRQIVYTGLTRAKKRAVIIGSESSLRAALMRKLERNTGVTIFGRQSPIRP